MWYYGYIWTLGLGYGNTYWRPSLSDPMTPATDYGADDEDVYRINNGDTNHARVAFSDGLQRITIINDTTGERKVISERNLAGNIDTGRNLYLFANNNNGKAASFAKSRLYWLKLWENGNCIRKFQPVRLKNGLVGLWDFVNEITYLPKSASGGFATFSAAGPVTAM